MNDNHERRTALPADMRVSRAAKADDTVFAVRGVSIGATPQLIAGPCAVESESQIEQCAVQLAGHGVRILRGGAHKPRTSPYSFHGLGDEGYALLSTAAHRHGMICVSEVLDERSLQAAVEEVDILQIGMRNMSNFHLLAAVRETGKPVLLKRNIAATYEELLHAAEYLIAGTDRVILCERGIRTFETWTRNTLDIAAVPVLRDASHLPVCVDVSHAAGRPDIVPALARASLAAGANLVMIEVHPSPAEAKSDSHQQLDFAAFAHLMAVVRDFLPQPC
jgi:3-deoxy-7-phosphoheptulonate synthase/chorismate mutase